MTSPAPPAPERRGIGLSLALAAATFVIAAALSGARIGTGAPDFYVFWTAANHLAAPYDPAIVAQLEASLRLHGTWPFAYPPTFLLLLQPFARLPMTLAYPLWTGLTAALFMFAGSRLIKPAWAAAALLVVPPVFFSAALGQTTLAIGAAMIGGWLCLERRPAVAGVLFAIAACIKPQAMILAPLVLWGHWRVLGWMVGAGAALVAASLVLGLGPWLEWPHAVAAFAAVAPGADRANPSALIASPVWAALLAAFGLLFAWKNRNLLGMVGGAICLTPYAHGYDLAPLAPLALAWLVQPREQGWGRAAAGGALLAGVVSTPITVLAFLAALFLLPLREKVSAKLTDEGSRRRWGFA